MRTSFKKLRAFSISPTTKRNSYAGDTKPKPKPKPKPQPQPQPPIQPHYDELSHASQDVREMKEFYESLIFAAAATSNSAFEFSESLKEMGTCLLEKTAVNDDEERGKVLLMLGKVQFELQKLADNYRSHVVRTIQNPSESLIAQLETLEDMKKQCDEKRSTYQDMLSSYRENRRSSKCHNKTENISYKQLEAARDEYEEETNLFAFRLKSLKGAQSHSLLTQASRHHAAQLCFFKRALKSLQLIEPDVKLIAEEQHIDYQFCELEDDDDEDTSYMEEESIDNDENSVDIELSFDFGQSDEKEKDITVVSSSPGKSMELDGTGHPSPPVGAVDVVKEKVDSKGGLRFPIAVFRENKISQSAPILSTKKVDHVPQRFAQLRQSASSKKKIHSYVLPTPDEMKNSDPRVVETRTFFGRDVQNYLHSSPLQQTKIEETRSVSVSVAVPTNRNTGASTPFPPPIDEKLMRPQIDTCNPEQERKKIRRMAFSGPLNKPSSFNGPVFLKGKPLLLFSGPLFNNSKVLSSSISSSPPKLSPGSSPTRGSAPIISELHELPRPPTHPHQLIHSGPLLSTIKQGSPIANKFSGSKMMPPPPRPPLLLLPPPPQTVPRSFSVPSNVKRVVVTSSEESRNATKTGIDLSSPPLTPILHPATGT